MNDLRFCLLSRILWADSGSESRPSVCYKAIPWLCIFESHKIAWSQRGSILARDFYSSIHVTIG
jgi:hypothetical protein